ncbi:MAG: hypothetical protein M0Z28_11740 [Rhodospirillales bacterium]|nr:hypothetical protein [Rhodospirillales bacterium]
MPKGPMGERRPADVIGAAVKVTRTATGEEAAVIALHHLPKSGDTPRGWGGLAGDADVTLRVVGEPGERKTATLMKNRNGPSGVALAFEVRAVAIGEDEDGETVTAPVCEERAARAAGTRLAPHRGARRHRLGRCGGGFIRPRQLILDLPVPNSFTASPPASVQSLPDVAE